ncbi:coiled-coil domain-containing protein 13-like isoform X2 [Argiope bruennichi]|nr:coiled-coil domain-containing protein 13-like isoform X2 [Argiope bruennichi]
MHLKRKAGLEEMNQCVENLVKECLFWKKQLEGLTYQNWLLESEKRSLRADYEELLEKTKHDMGIILNLKDSKKKLDHETKEYIRTDRELSTLYSINTDLTSDKLLLESKKSELLDCLKKNTANMKRINKLHNWIQNLIEKEKKRGERNSKRYKEEMGKLNKALTADDVVFGNFKEILADHEQLIVDLESFLNIGLKEYLNPVSTEDDAKESSKQDTENISEIDTLNETVVNEKVIPKDDEPASDNLTAVEKNIFEEWRKNKISSVLIENENYHLLRHYEYLHKRMKDLNERYIEMADLRNMKEAELHRYMAKATDLYHTVTMKRKKFVIPPRDEREDLRIRIRTQMNENEALRKFLSLSFSYTNEDLQFQEEFTHDLKEFYTRLFHQEKTGTKSAVDSDEQTTPESVKSE